MPLSGNMLKTRVLAGAAALVLAAISVAAADDWTAIRLRGQVIQLVNNQWVPLQRGDVVPDTRYVATMATGHVELARGGEIVSLDPNTQIRIFDKGGPKPFTTVKQDFGSVAVEAEVQQVQHFAVQTPYLAAVVKGTRFTVTSGRTGSSVAVHRGHVEVDDQHNQTHVTLSVGQSASVDKVATAGTIAVAGGGPLPPVLDKKGKPVGTSAGATAKQTAAELAAAAKAAEAQAKLLKTPEAKAAADAAKKAADEAKKEAQQAAKDDKKAADVSKKEADQTAKDDKKASGQATKDADKAAKDADKAAKDAGK